MKKCVIVPDSFKGSLDAGQVCAVLRQAVLRRAPGCEVVCVPVADGGEGTVDCFLEALGCTRVETRMHGPYGELLTGAYARQGNTAVIEMAQAAGLPLVEGRADPSRTTTWGVGEQIAQAIDAGCTEILLGLGGSCTNDGGCGMAAALGARFYDQAGVSFVPTGGTLDRIARIDREPLRRRLAGVRVTAMCDVDSPLYGPQGAACVFAPQKGADDAMVRRLDENLRALARHLGEETTHTPGAGAAGGMGAGVLSLLGGVLRPGIEAVLDVVTFDRLLAGADLVLTGEGCFDRQSLCGKVIDGVARRAARQGVPVVALVGTIGEPDALEAAYARGVTAVIGINQSGETLAQAKARVRDNLARTADAVLRLWERETVLR